MLPAGMDHAVSRTSTYVDLTYFTFYFSQDNYEYKTIIFFLIMLGEELGSHVLSLSKSICLFVFF